LRRRDQLVGCVGVTANEDASLPAGRDRHVPADEERETAEHPLLGQAVFVCEQLTDAFGQLLVVRRSHSLAQLQPWSQDTAPA
jgi:hypothetical protein